jgi:hypothetical protein
MLRDNRILFKKAAGAFQDLSPALSDIHAKNQILDFAVGDHLYLGSRLPFNHRYFDVSSPNGQAAVPTIEYWNGNAWTAAVDIVDETAVNGASLGQAGILSWRLNPYNFSWGWADTERMTGSGLETLKMYGLFWLRITWNATMATTTALNYLGHKFSEDASLECEYPALSNPQLKNAWKAGKGDWDEQTLLAAEYIIQELKGPRRKLVSPDQIFSWQIFEKASVHRTAMIIFRGMGADYVEELKTASSAFKSALDLRVFDIDENGNGDLDPEESSNCRVENLTR